MRRVRNTFRPVFKRQVRFKHKFPKKRRYLVQVFLFASPTSDPVFTSETRRKVRAKHIYITIQRKLRRIKQTDGRTVAQIDRQKSKQKDMSISWALNSLWFFFTSPQNKYLKFVTGNQILTESIATLFVLRLHGKSV